MKPFHTTLLPLITPKEVYECSDQFDIFRGSDKAGIGWTQHLGEEARSWQKIGTASNLEQPATLTRTRGETSTSSCKKTSMHVSGCKDLTLEPGSPCWVYSCDAYESLHQLQQEKKKKKSGVSVCLTHRAPGPDHQSGSGWCLAGCCGGPSEGGASVAGRWKRGCSTASQRRSGGGGVGPPWPRSADLPKGQPISCSTRL